jgi:hypothetical protein
MSQAVYIVLCGVTDRYGVDTLAQDSRDHAWVLISLNFLRELFGVRFDQTISPN